jgi:hypothetical protein
MKIIGVIAFAVVMILLGYLLHTAQVGGLRVLQLGEPVNVSYSDLVAILLTAFAVIIAVAGIALAVAGVVGWNSIEGKAMRTAENVTRANLDDEKSRLHKIIKDAVRDPASPLHRTLKKEAQRVMFEGVMDVDNDHDEPPDVATSPEENK